MRNPGYFSIFYLFIKFIFADVAMHRIIYIFYYIYYSVCCIFSFYLIFYKLKVICFHLIFVFLAMLVLSASKRFILNLGVHYFNTIS